MWPNVLKHKNFSEKISLTVNPSLGKQTVSFIINGLWTLYP